MGEFLAMGIIGSYLLGIVVLVMSIMLPFFVYGIYNSTKELNETMKKILKHAEYQSQQLERNSIPIMRQPAPKPAMRQ